MSEARALVKSMSFTCDKYDVPRMTAEFMFPNGMPDDITDVFTSPKGIRFSAADEPEKITDLVVSRGKLVVNASAMADGATITVEPPPSAIEPSELLGQPEMSLMDELGLAFGWLARPVTDLGRDWRILLAAVLLAWACVGCHLHLHHAEKHYHGKGAVELEAGEPDELERRWNELEKNLPTTGKP